MANGELVGGSADVFKTSEDQALKGGKFKFNHSFRVDVQSLSVSLEIPQKPKGSDQNYFV